MKLLWLLIIMSHKTLICTIIYDIINALNAAANVMFLCVVYCELENMYD